MRRILLALLLITVLSIYLSQASFSYFSDTETITAELAAAGPSSSATVLYENATLTFFCHLPCCSQGGDADTGKVIETVETARKDPKSLEHAPQCFRRICDESKLSGVYIESEGTPVLENITVVWWGGGRLIYVKIDDSTFEVDSTAPARVEVGVALEDGLHSVEFGFEGLTLPVFDITFVFDGAEEEVYFVPCVEFKWV